MILASGIGYHIGFDGIFGTRALIFIALLMLWLMVEKIEDRLAPLVIFPAIFCVYLINPFLLSKSFAFRHPDYTLPLMILLPIFALLGGWKLRRSQTNPRCRFDYCFLGIIPMILALHDFWGLLFQSLLCGIVYHHCCRFNESPDFQVRLVRSCTRLIFIVLPITWPLAVWDIFHGLATMTGAGKNAILIICYADLLSHITLELFMLLPLLIWLLRQNKLRQTQNPGESHEN